MIPPDVLAAGPDIIRMYLAQRWWEELFGHALILLPLAAVIIGVLIIIHNAQEENHGR